MNASLSSRSGTGDLRFSISGSSGLPDDACEAIYLVDKPSGPTSFDVVRRIRSATGIRRVGHAGTLDPMASGLLICMVGAATRSARWFAEMPKSYRATMRLGERTPSFDAETPVSTVRPYQHVTSAALIEAARQFTGQIVQHTPAYSAVRVEGKPLYASAREGKEVSRPPRVVDIYELSIEAFNPPDVQFRIVCSMGTYVRAIADDLGQMLGTVAHLVALRRTAIGQFSVDDAWELDTLCDAITTKRLDSRE